MMDGQEEKPKFIIKAAFATDNGKTFMSRHFGDAGFFDIYSIDENSFCLIKKVINSSEEENRDNHADPEKAKSISGILLKENVNTVVSRIFGPNIKRISEKFVCVLMDDIHIEK